ncbi:MAG: GlsB/YeaQ/YmgE family stress response membrane protein [Hyphomicrobium sp.]
MALEALLVLLVIGAIAGFLAGQIVKGYGFGVIGNIVVGIVGAFLGGLLLPRLGLFAGGDIIGQIITATLGAVILLVLLGILRRA